MAGTVRCPYCGTKLNYSTPAQPSFADCSKCKRVVFVGKPTLSAEEVAAEDQRRFLHGATAADKVVLGEAKSVGRAQWWKMGSNPNAQRAPGGVSFVPFLVGFTIVALLLLLVFLVWHEDFVEGWYYWTGNRQEWERRYTERDRREKDEQARQHARQFQLGLEAIEREQREKESEAMNSAVREIMEKGRQEQERRGE